MALHNHPMAVLGALSAGYGAEVDVWGCYFGALLTGHDTSQHQLVLDAGGPSEPRAGPLVLHLKSPASAIEVREVVYLKGWLDHTYFLFSPSDDGRLETLKSGGEGEAGRDGTRTLAVADSVDTFDLLVSLPDPLGGADGVWLEQPEVDWVDADVVQAVYDVGRSAWVVSSELHGRRLELARLDAWRGADGIVTDYPHLLARVLDVTDPVMHPTEPWWS